MAYDRLCYKPVDIDYRAAKDCRCEYAVPGGAGYSDRYISYTTSGIMVLHQGYGCDGPSVPGKRLQRRWNIRAAFFHDGHHQLARMGLFSHRHRKAADQLFLRMMREDIDYIHAEISYDYSNWFTRRVRKAYNASERQAQRATAYGMYLAVRGFAKSHWVKRDPAPTLYSP